MAVNKVIFGGNTIMDVTDTTATASDVMTGKTFYTADGVKTEGTNAGGGSTSKSTTLTIKPPSASTTWAISGLPGKPLAWSLTLMVNMTSASTRYVVSANGNGTTPMVQYAYKSGNNGYVYYSTSYITSTYSNGTLTLKTSSATNGGNFYNGNYRFVYVV